MTRDAAKDIATEVTFFSDFIEDRPIELIVNQKFSSYMACMKSRLTVGWHSTLLLEVLALRRRLVMINWSGWKKAAPPMNFAYALDHPTMDEACQVVMNTLEQSEEEYWQAMEEISDYLIKPVGKENPIDFLNEFIAKKVQASDHASIGQPVDALN